MDNWDKEESPEPPERLSSHLRRICLALAAVLGVVFTMVLMIGGLYVVATLVFGVFAANALGSNK